MFLLDNTGESNIIYDVGLITLIKINKRAYLMETFLVTGGAGFIGSHIAERLVQEGAKVRVIDNLLTGREQNLEGFRKQIEFINDDIRDEKAVRSAVKGVDYIFHEAALPSVARSIEDPGLATSINVSGTLNLLEAARAENVKRLVFAGSSSVYGDSPTLPKIESMSPSPLSPYAVTKLCGEHYTQVYWRIHKLPTVTLRYFNVFGPRQDPASEYAAVVPKFITCIAEDKQPTIYGDGLQSRDFTYVANIVDANLLAMRAPNVEAEVFNIACGQQINLLQLIDEINKILGKDISPKFETERQGDIKHSLADIGKAVERLAYSPHSPLNVGLKKTAEYYLR